MGWEQIIALLIQVPVVGVFIVFTVYLLREFRTSNANQLEIIIKFIDQQNARWAEQMEEERERRREAQELGMKEVESLASSIAELSKAVTAQTEALTRHDQAARERHDSLIREVKDNSGARGSSAVPERRPERRP